MNKFSAQIEIIGINPYVLLPQDVLAILFKESGKDKGHIPVTIKVDGHEFQQTLVKYRGLWRLYLNTPMRQAAQKDLGQEVIIEISYDPSDRAVPVNKKLASALMKNKEAKKVFDNLSPSHQKEINKYISNLKTEESINRNVNRAIDYLLGKERFIGRDKP